MVVFQRLHGVGEGEGHVHFDLIVGLVGAVAASGGTGAEVHRGQALIANQFVDVIGDTVLVEVLVLLRVTAGFILENKRHTVVYHSLAAQHIFKAVGRDGDVGKDLGVRLPADDRAGALALERLLLQAAHVLAFFKVEVVVEAIAVDVGGHPLAGVLGGTQAQAIEAQAEIVVAAALGVFAAGVQLAEDKVPVPAVLSLVVVHRDAAAEVLNLNDVVGVEGDVDAVAMAVTGFIDGVGDDLKDGMGTAFHTVRAKNNGRALTHTVRAFQLADAVVAVFLLFFCHAAVPPELCGVA